MSFHEYSGAYSPAMPVCQIYLGSGGDEPNYGPFEALLDTGADVSVIRTGYLDLVGASRVNRRRARSVWGASRSVDVYAVALAVNGLRFTALQVLADDVGDEIILGRTVLNRLKITFDGPAATTEIISE